MADRKGYHGRRPRHQDAITWHRRHVGVGSVRTVTEDAHPAGAGSGDLSANGRALWVTDGQDDPDLHATAMEALNAPPSAPFEIDGFAKRGDGTSIYAFRLRDLSGQTLAVVTMQVPVSGEERPFSLVLSLVRPALSAWSAKSTCAYR